MWPVAVIVFSLAIEIGADDLASEACRELAYVDLLRAQQVAAIVLAGSGYHDAAFTRELGAKLRAYEEAGGRVAVIGGSRTERREGRSPAPVRLEVAAPRVHVLPGQAGEPLERVLKLLMLGIGDRIGVVGGGMVGCSETKANGPSGW